MGQNYETWLVLASLAVCVVAVLVWIKDAGDDWLCDRSGSWDTQRRPAVPGAAVDATASAGETQHHAGARLQT